MRSSPTQGVFMKKLQEKQKEIDEKVLKFINKNKKHIQMAAKTFILMLITSFVAGFCYTTLDYYFAFVYIIVIAIFLYFIPFERIFFPSYYQKLDNNKKEDKTTNKSK